MKDYLGKLNSRLPLERIPKNLIQDIHLYYLEDEQNYFYTVTVNLSKDDSELNNENRNLSNFTIFKIHNKKNTNPVIGICDLLGEIINSNYDIANTTKHINVTYYQPEIGKVLKQRTNTPSLTQETYNQKLEWLNLNIRNYLNKVHNTQINNDDSPKRHFQNNKLPQPPTIRELIDELYNNSFIVPMKCNDCSNSEKLPKDIDHLINRKVPTLLKAPVNDIKKGEITVYSDASYDVKSEKFVATCMIFFKGLQWIQQKKPEYLVESRLRLPNKKSARRDSNPMLKIRFKY